MKKTKKNNIDIKAVAKANDNFSLLMGHDSLLDRAYPLRKTGDYLKAAKGWVYACTNVIAEEVAGIELKLFEVKKNKVEEVQEHDALDLLYRANNFTTKFDLFYATQQMLELAGEAPWLLIKKNNQITDILVLRPDLLIVVPGKEKFIDRYLYRVGLGGEIKIEPENLILFKYPDTTNPYRGTGTLQAVAKTVDIDNFSEDYNRNFFYNSAVPSSIISTEQKLTDETIKRLKFQIDKLYKGVDKAHKTAIFEQGLEWKAMQMSHKDMDFLEQSKFSRDKILGIFRVPRTVLGITDDVNRANAEATDYVFSRRTIKPKMQRLVEQLNEFFLPMFKGTENMYFGFDDPVPENVELKLKEYEAGLKNGYLTINEVREREGLDSIGAAGDGIYLPFSVTNVLEAKPTDTAKKINGQLKHINARNRKNIKLDLQEKISEKLLPIAKEMLKETAREKKANNDIIQKKLLIEENTAFQKFWSVKDAGARKLENGLENELIGFFEKQSKQISSALAEKSLMSEILKKIEKILNKDKTKFRAIIAPVLLEAIDLSAKQTEEFINISTDIDKDNPVARNYVREHGLELSKDISQTSRNEIKKAIESGLKEGEGMAKIARRIKSVYETMGTKRATVIARTEVINASNFATLEVYKASKIVKAKTWLTALDERTCPICAGLDGTTKGLNDTFDVGTGFVDAPTAHPNCRCTLVPEI